MPSLPWNRSIIIRITLILAQTVIAIDPQAQAFDNRFGNFNREQIEFDSEFVRQNKLRSIRVDFSRKLPGKPIEKLPDQDRMEYDDQGRIISRLSIRSTRISVDTIWQRWAYQGNEVVKEWRKDALGEYRSEAVRDETGRVISWKRYRNDILINEESYRYAIVQDTLVQQTYINADGLAYKTLTTKSYGDGRLAELTERFNFSGRSCRLIHHYNEYGWISECVSENEKGTERTVYEYSDLGEIMKVSHYSGDSMESSLEVLYEDGLPDAWIRKELDTNHLRIGQFSYQ